MSSVALLRALCALTVIMGSSLLTSCAADAEGLKVSDAWARATPPGVQVAGVFLTISNAGAADKLLKVSTPLSDRAEIHETSHVGDQMQMRQVEVLEVPKGGRVVFQPGGLHLMLMDIKSPLLEGETLSLTLTFERAGAIEVQASVSAIGASGGADHAGHH